MGTVNGKLINQKSSQLDELTQKTEQINQRCEYLESQLTIIGTKNDKQYLQKLEQRILFLEKVTKKQTQKLSFLKIGTIIGLVSLWLMFGINNQSRNDENQLQNQTQSMKIIQPNSQELFLYL